MTTPLAGVASVAPVVNNQSGSGHASGQATTGIAQKATSTAAQKPVDALLDDILNDFLAQTKRLMGNTK